MKVKRSELREQVADELAGRQIVCNDLRIARREVDRLRAELAKADDKIDAQAHALSVAEDEAFTVLATKLAGEAQVRNILRAAGGGQTRPDIAKVRRLCREYLDA